MANGLYWFLNLLLLAISLAAKYPRDASKCGADVVFVLDSSSSIWPPDFGHQLEFVRDVVDSIYLPSGTIRIAVVTFSDHADIQFGLDVYRNAADIKEALSSDNIRQAKGTTNTAKALQLARNIITASHSHITRRIVVVITDGQSNEPPLTKEEAEQLKSTGVTVFAIGVGHKVDMDELRAIASQPTSHYVLTTPDHKALTTIEHFLDVQTCQEPIQPPHLEICDAKDADVIFVLDASSSIWPPDFEKQLEFVQDVTKALYGRGGTMRIGLLTYSDKAAIQFELHTFSRIQDVTAAVSKLTQTKGRTNTAEALSTALDMFTLARKNILKLAVVITDGQSMEPELTVYEAKKLKESGVKAFAIGVGKSVDDKELEAIASEPTDKFKLHVTDYQALDSIHNFLGTCSKQENISELKGSSRTGCNQDVPAHVVFALPANARPEDTNKALMFYRQVAENLDIGKERVRISIVSVECPSQSVSFESETFQSRDDLINKIQPITVADTTSLLKKIKDKFSRNRLHTKHPRLSSSNSDPAEFGILIVEEGSKLSAAAKAEANALKTKYGAKLFVIIVGEGQASADVQSLATHPSHHHTLNVLKYDELEQWAEDLARRINESCEDVRRIRL